MMILFSLVYVSRDLQSAKRIKLVFEMRIKESKSHIPRIYRPQIIWVSPSLHHADIHEFPFTWFFHHSHDCDLLYIIK